MEDRRMKDLRTKMYLSGFTVQEIAEQIGVARSTVNRWMLFYDKTHCELIEKALSELKEGETHGTDSKEG